MSRQIKISYTKGSDKNSWLEIFKGLPLKSDPEQEKIILKSFRWARRSKEMFQGRVRLYWVVLKAFENKGNAIGIFSAPDRSLAVMRNGNNVCYKNYLVVDLSTGRFLYYQNIERVLAVLSFYMATDRQKIFEEQLSGGSDTATAVLRIGMDVRNILKTSRPEAILLAFESIKDTCMLQFLCRNLSVEAAAAVIATKDRVLSRFDPMGTFQKTRDKILESILDCLNK